MVKIRVICGGCGIEYRDEHGNVRHMLKTREDGPFDCDTEAAARLVSLEVAEYVGEQMIPGEGSSSGEKGFLAGKLPDTDSLDEEDDLPECAREEIQLRAMKIKDLDLLARNRGLDTSQCKKKDDYIGLLLEEDEEEPPVLGEADPV